MLTSCQSEKLVPWVASTAATLTNGTWHNEIRLIQVNFGELGLSLTTCIRFLFDGLARELICFRKKLAFWA